jgi:hypothetical protein
VLIGGWLWGRLAETAYLQGALFLPVRGLVVLVAAGFGVAATATMVPAWCVTRGRRSLSDHPGE